MNKPKYLYHASPIKDIKVFEPRAESIRNSEEGSVVFASTDIVSVSKFLVVCNDSWSRLGAFNGIHFAVYGDKNKFKKLDKGGGIYKLSSNTFEIETKYGGAKNEWTSKVSVKPISKKIYKSGLEAMLDFGVQVYFVDNNAFNSIIQSDDHGRRILMNSLSENQKLNRNIKNI